MDSAKNTARITGLIGLIVLITGSFAYTVNSKLIVPGDAITTAENLIENESLFRLGIVSGLFMEIIFMFYAFLLYSLLRQVNKNYATMMIIIAIIPVPLFLLNQLNLFATLLLAEDGMLNQILFFLELYKYGGLVVSIFFGLWLLPLGYLVYKSGYLPKIIGIVLMIGCFGYLISFFQGFLFPGKEKTLWTNPFLVVTHISEILLMFWLLIKGVNEDRFKNT
ncbi:DUF4386 domain-containing protein [Aquimarina mytili]|uniref:DUF4386 domain-containing protein n=1 Tax=Aquimarina mytili TaxID=874423 RepID=A0A936ZQW3_9FLAO|nr:DUF4386 domain-containing protein [Aquimarina mytili]MBL0683984.1 DUF4386 domain-containing protein [Aquimarina mytili]